MEFCTPKLISQHFKEGIMEIEDFGNKTLLDYVKNLKINSAL